MKVFQKKEVEQSNQLQQRIQEISMLLAKNNNQIGSSKVNLKQFMEIVDHCFNCYDQLDFIYLKYLQEEEFSQHRKKQFKMIRQLMKNGKYLIKNIGNWLKSHQFQLNHQHPQKYAFEQQIAHFRNTCKLCSKNAQEIVIRQAKKELIGPMHWRQLFDNELMNQEENSAQISQSINRQNREYNSSVSYLSKVIQDMEKSLQRDEQMMQNLNHQSPQFDSRGFSLLQQIISKLKKKMGQKCLPKMNEIIQKQLLRTTSCFNQRKQSQKFIIEQQYSLFAGSIKKKNMNRTCPAKNQQELSKLMQQNRRLTLQKDMAQQLYMSANSFMNNMANAKIQKQKSMFSKNKKDNIQKNREVVQKEDEIHQENNRDSILTKNQREKESQVNESEVGSKIIYKDRVQKVGAVSSFVKTKKNSSRLLQRFSAFNVSKASFRKSDLSYVDKTIGEGDNQLSREQIIESQTADINLNYDQLDYENEVCKDVGCQWQASDCPLQKIQQQECNSPEDNGESTICIKTSENIASKKQSKSIKDINKEGSFQTKTSLKLNKSLKKQPPQSLTTKSSTKKLKQPQKPKTNKQIKKLDEKVIHNRQSNKQNKSKVIKQNEENQNIIQRFQISQTNTFKHIRQILQTQNNQDIYNQSEEQYLTNRNSMTTLPRPSTQQSSIKYRFGAQTKETNRKTIKEDHNDSQKFIRKVNFHIQGDKNQQRNTVNNLSQLKKDSFKGTRLQPIFQAKDSQITSCKQCPSTKNIKSSKSINNVNHRFSHLNGIDQITQSSPQKEYLSRHNYTSSNKKSNKKKQEYFNNRIATQGNQREYHKKGKKVRNGLFQPEHLCIFGGISQSYHYHSLQLQLDIDIFNQNQKNYSNKLVTYLCNLKGFKRNMYENIIIFLKNPYKTIQKTQLQFTPISNNALNQIILKLLLFHKKKCSSINCTHIQTFTQIIGFSNFFFH